MRFKVLKPGEEWPDDGQYYLADYQYEFITAQDDVVLGVMGRGTGKSVIAGVTIAQHLKNGASGMLLAPTFEDCDVTLNVVIEYLEESKTKFKHNKSKHRIRLKRNGATLYYRPTESNKGIRGKTDLSFLVVDEAALCRRERYLEALGCLRGKIKFRRIYLITTPKGRGNWVYEEAMKPGVKLIIRKTTDSPFLDAGFFETLASMYSGDFLDQEVNAAWIDLTACLLYSESDYDSLNVKRNLCEGKVIVGLDVAVGGDPSSCAILRGLCIQKILSRKTSTDISTLLDLMRDALGGLEPDYVCVDSTGVGAFAPAEIRKKWPRCMVIPVNFSDSAVKQGYENRRVEIHFDLKDKIEKGLYFGENVNTTSRETVQKQMRATEYMIGRKSMYRLISKKEIKEKIGRSPDELDSLALACSLDQAVIAQMMNSRVPQISGAIPQHRS